jgi:hypothetical protein
VCRRSIPAELGGSPRRLTNADGPANATAMKCSNVMDLTKPAAEASYHTLGEISGADRLRT